MSKEFPRKEFYVYTSKAPLGEGTVIALNDREFSIGDVLREYSEKRWESDNKGWTSSVMPTVMDVEHDGYSMKLHCSLTEYKYLLGMVKFADEKEKSGLTETIHGLSTEIMPMLADGTFPLERRARSTTQHGVGFYDIPSAGQNAQMWLNKVPKEYSGLVNDLFDMNGFPRWNLIRNMGFKPEEIGEIFYTGFSRGFEVSLDSQFNGYVRIKAESEEIKRRAGNEDKLFYKFDDFLDILSSVNNDGKSKKIKEDIYGKVPEPREDGFKIIDDCFGTLLSNIFHIQIFHILGEKYYQQGLEILIHKGYKINEINDVRTNLLELN